MHGQDLGIARGYRVGVGGLVRWIGGVVQSENVRRQQVLSHIGTIKHSSMLFVSV